MSTTEERVVFIDCTRIRPFANQPRKYFHPQRMEELTASIREFGQKKAGEVKVLPPGESHEYEIVDGERRFKVCSSLGIPFKTIVSEKTSENEQFLDAVIANYGGEGHTELETMGAILRIRRDFDFTLEKTAAVFGRSVGWVQQYLSLKKLDPTVIEMMDPKLPDGQRLVFSHALRLTELRPSLQIEIAQAATGQGLKLKEVKYLVERHTGQSTRAEGFSPRKEYENFRAFLQRTMVDLELLLKRPKDYFANMFEHRVPDDLEKMAGMVKSAIDNLTLIKQALDRAKAENAKRRAE